MKYDVVGDVEIVAVMVAGTVHEQQDELPPIPSGQCLEKIWKHSVSGAGMIR